MEAAINDKVWSILAAIMDPEIPVLSIVDLGIVRSIELNNQQLTISITPTYSGCPAMDIISMQVKMSLLNAGFELPIIKQKLSPVWTTDWITNYGKQQLKAYGIAPPIGKSFDGAYLEDIIVPCPQCNSTNTLLISQFGSTSCKALFKCLDCMEPFDYFKCH
ncbi:MAG: phenylacetate-CoA oxygenase subunit PaaJ [Sphingobacteriia bacterium]|jgi:ring-1,2-phenylacetyl-CoA epoxidase subunit PaaD|nr:MAG: phenylacetate-CoA oxygenase subunit PaaJ [Sphingobacteriia bacterium]TAH07057.1 MAG: phenylacetate-CoA oxygenase subunit PaaJ [Sphingobacteriia bacterium]